MASFVSESQDLPEPARKRQKRSPSPVQPSANVTSNTVTGLMSGAQEMALNLMISQRERESQAGILCFVNESNPGFSGILKQRYTDFLVNEVTLDGCVVHLTDTNVPRHKATPKPPRRSPSPSTEAVIEVKEPLVTQAETDDTKLKADGSRPVSEGTVVDPRPIDGFTMSTDDTALLDSYFGVHIRAAILNLHGKLLLNPQAKPGSLGSVSSEPITDRQLRGRLHQDIRRIFSSRFDTVTGADDVVKITVAQKVKPQGRFGQSGNGRDSGRNHQKRSRPTWQELGGEHLHFSLYKENKDTMEVISYISSQLKTSPRQFSFAGTKDRRGVTVQRVSVLRVYADALANLNRTLRGSKVGNFQYEKHRLELGDLMGNEFLITLRDCTFGGSNTVDGTDKAALADKVIGAAVKNMQAHGFINYYGLQRFGTYAIGTHDVGTKILQGDFEEAVNAILAYGDDALACALDTNFVPADGKPLPRDDIARAEALHIFKTTGESQKALEKLPRKFSGETSIIRHMKRNRRDFIGALIQIPRNLRLMYVHAYQSLVWNMVASERWTRYGHKIIKGDLVLVDSEAAKHIASVKEHEVDENGEIIVLPSAGDTAISHDDLWERARALTAEEAASGKYNIFDIVLPTPGYDIEYPDNDVGEYYKEFMASERGGGLDPGNMRRSQQDFSLSGSYRKLLAQIGKDITYEIKVYNDDNEQMVETDLEKITKSRVNFGTREQDIRSRGAHENGRDQRGRQNYGDWEARQNNGDNIQRENTAKQRDAWKNLPSKLAEDEKAQADFLHNQKDLLSDLPKVELSQPAYKETFIQTSAEHGKRTGHRETNIMPGVKVDAPAALVDNKPAEEEVIGGQLDGAAESKSVLFNKLKAEGVEGTANSALDFKDMGADPKGGFEVRHGDNEETVEEISENSGRKEAECGKVPKVREKIAVIVKFQLGSSQYATMALRELMKQGGVQTFKPEFGTGR